MRAFIGILVILFPATLLGQFKLDTARIKSDPITDTTDQAFYGRTHGLPSLARSDNFLEIRMSVFYAPVGGFEDRVITFDGKIWSATVFQSPLNLYDSAATKVTPLKPRKSFPYIVQRLIDLGLFTLPSQHELNKPHRVFDGDLYSITYKVGNKYRQLTFDNPGMYKELYRGTKAFRKYEKIVDVFFRYLEKE
jgi:hypothetical protein